MTKLLCGTRNLKLCYGKPGVEPARIPGLTVCGEPSTEPLGPLEPPAVQGLCECSREVSSRLEPHHSLTYNAKFIYLVGWALQEAGGFCSKIAVLPCTHSADTLTLTKAPAALVQSQPAPRT